jgi:replication factor A1
MMKISELKSGISDVSVEGKIIAKSEARKVRTRYGMRSVADATLQDDTGTIRLSLWEDQIDIVNQGDDVKITGAYMTEFRNTLQLNIPRSGKLVVTKQNILEL